MRVVTTLVDVPAGTYILGDPCYVIADNQWEPLLKSANYFVDSSVGKLTVGDKTHKVLGFGTAWGDGCYQDNLGNEYPVDSGLIGLVPIEVAQIDESLIMQSMFPPIKVTFDRPVLCENTNGVMKFGHIRIDTRNEGAEENDDE